MALVFRTKTTELGGDTVRQGDGALRPAGLGGPSPEWLPSPFWGLGHSPGVGTGCCEEKGRRLRQQNPH